MMEFSTAVALKNGRCQLSSLANDAALAMGVFLHFLSLPSFNVLASLLRIAHKKGE
jgi:hypothetical protein